MAGTNMTSKEIEDWKKNITNYKKTLITSLDNVKTLANLLSQETATAQGDEDNLSYRYRDLSNLADAAAGKLRTFVKELNTAISDYLKDTKAAEDSAAEDSRKSIDNFAEEAEKIKNLGM